MDSSENNECNKRKSVLNLATHFESAAIESAKDKPNRGTKMDITTECTNTPVTATASSETDESEKRESVSNLATRFELAAIESAKSKPSREPDGDIHADTTVDYTEPEEVVSATFEKKVGDPLCFNFFFGKNSRGTTGLFIRSVRSESIERIIKPDDQLVKINDQDIRNSESDAVISILENLSGTVKVEVIRIKKPPVPQPPEKTISQGSNDNSQFPKKDKSVEIVHKSGTLNSKIQPMEIKNANPGIQQIQKTANIGTNGQTLEKKDSTTSDIKQPQQQSTERVKPETRESLNNYVTPETHKIQEKAPPAQKKYKNTKIQQRVEKQISLKNADLEMQLILREKSNMESIQKNAFEKKDSTKSDIKQLQQQSTGRVKPETQESLLKIQKDKSVEIVHKSGNLNSKIQPMEIKNANPGIQQIQKTANIGTNEQTLEKKDSTKSDIKQLQQQSTRRVKPETRESLGKIQKNKSVEMVHKSGNLNSKIQPMETKNANLGVQKIQKTANIGTNGQTLEKKDSTKSDIKQLQQQSTKTQESLNNYVTPETHKIQEKAPPAQKEYKNTKIQQPELEMQRILQEKNNMESIQKRLTNECEFLRATIKSSETLRNLQAQLLVSRNIEMQRLQQQNSSIVNENETLKKENINKKNQIENLWQNIENRNNEIQQLRQGIIRIEQEKNDKDSEIQNLQQENYKKNNEVQQLQQENSEKKRAISILERKNEINDTKIQQLRQQNGIIEQDKDNKDNEIRNLQQENNKKNNEIQQVRNEYQQLQKENSEKNNRIEHLQKENEIKNNEILQIRIENQRHKEDVESKKKEIRRLQQEIENSNKLAEKGSVVVSDEELGRGGYGAVHKGDFYGTKVAVKEYYQVILSNYNRKVLTREINMASQCRHPNLLQFICALENDKHHLLIVTELLDMTLRELIEQHAEAQSLLSSQDVQSISLDVARGLNYLHSKKPDPIIHRDISSANVLLSIVNGVVARAKISDYGSVNVMELCKTVNPGAAIYAAPEAGSSKQDPKLDVFSYGILVCEMSICVMPDPMNRREQINQILHIGIRELVNNCTRDKSKERPNMHNVITTWENMKME